MRVLMLPSWYPHDGDALAGIFVRRQIEAVAAHCSVAVLCVVPDAGLAEDRVRVETANEAGLHVVRVRLGSASAGFGPTWAATPGYRDAAAAGLAQLLAGWGCPDLCHVHVLPHPGRIALQLRARLATPYVVSEHWSVYLAADGRYARAGDRPLTESVVAGASGIAPVSTALRDAMRGHGLEGTYHVVPNVVPRRPDVAPPPPRTGGLRLLCVARLDDAEKNLSGLMRAFALLPPSRRAGVRLDIVGGGPDRDWLESLRLDLGLRETIRLHGERPNAEIGTWITRAHMLVCNSWFETFSISTAEALVHGRPVIATACGGPADYLDPTWSIIVPTGNTRALADALDRAEAAYPGLALAARHAFDGRPFLPDAVGERLLGLYEDVLACPAASLPVMRPGARS